MLVYEKTHMFADKRYTAETQNFAAASQNFSFIVVDQQAPLVDSMMNSTSAFSSLVVQLPWTLGTTAGVEAIAQRPELVRYLSNFV